MIAAQSPLDILIFGGQSNMQGQTEALPIPNEPVDGASEYRYLTDSLIPLQHPVGELIGDSLLLVARIKDTAPCFRIFAKLTARLPAIKSLQFTQPGVVQPYLTGFQEQRA